MIIAHNMMAMNAQRQFNMVGDKRAKSTERLSSGYKINRAADDAAGLSISEKMRKQIRGLDRASTNTQDGISMVQTAEGALAEVHKMLDRMTELTIQAANGTNSEQDRDDIQQEINQLKQEINRVQTTGKFNELKLFPENGHSPDEDLGLRPAISLDLEGRTFEFEYIGTNGAPAAGSATGVGSSGIDDESGRYIMYAGAYAVKGLKTKFPELFKASSSDVRIGLNTSNIDGPSGTLASAAISLHSVGGSSELSYTLNIDTSDFPMPVSSLTEPQKSKLSSTIAHEMTHLIMDDTLTGGMLGNFPSWFVEGMAQTASGDGGWLSGSLSASSNDTDIKNYMSKAESMPYGAGYLAVMTLGMELSGSGTASSSNISSGLDKLFHEMVEQQKAGKPINADEALKTASGGKFNTFSDYIGNFKRAGGDTFDEVKSFLTAKGAGAGSLLDELNATENIVFNDSRIRASGGTSDYRVDWNYSEVKNIYSTGYIPASPRAVGSSIEDGGDVILQVGADAGGSNQIGVKRFNISERALFGGQSVEVTTQDKARKSIDLVSDAKDRVSKVRSYYGAIQNRLEHTIKNLDNVVENTTAAESRIRDTDMAKEMVQNSLLNILSQAGTSMIAQANQSKEGVLSLLQ